ncbi:EAL domain-containing protein [Trinickia fusca]|uniref:EAL domain-containing protein n=2 Tax=Trinickia fusca TaxID=2419777 RepID=A0A494XAM7_9BURK|nr:EAL domain-containing protein [Trinickia fusca]
MARVKLAGVCVALLISSAVLLVYQAVTLRTTLTENANLQAEMIADNVSASVMFADARSTAEVLHSLGKVPYVEEVCIYTESGKLFAGYRKPGFDKHDHAVGSLAKATSQGKRLSLSDVFVASTISQNGKTLGYVVLVAGTSGMLAQLLHYGGFLVAASMCAIWIAFAVTSRMGMRIVQAEKKLEYLASTDPLTGLPNRRAFYEELDERLQDALASATRVALILVDLDDFKTINDTLGHGAGDDLLKHVAIALRQAVRKTDVVSRIGGDEFAVLVEAADHKAEGLATAERIARALARPFDLTRASVVATASVGVSVYPDDAEDVAALVSSADIALYAAKSTGKNVAVAFHPSMTVEAHRRARLETELRKAIDADALHLVYQPQFDCRTSQLIGAEALVRWTHPSDGEISPAEFIPVAEGSELIVALGQWVLRRACLDAARWNAEHDTAIHVSVNVSARQLRQAQFTEQVKAVLDESGLASPLLELELTESQLMANMAVGVEAMQQLRTAGVRLALDDFGTGYSSLSYLQSFPVNNLKIDRSFIRPLPQAGQPIVAAIISMARSFGIAVVAEGVEEPSQLAWLCDAGCDIVQGYLTGRPMPVAQFRELLGAEIC